MELARAGAEISAASAGKTAAFAFFVRRGGGLVRRGLAGRWMFKVRWVVEGRGAKRRARGCE